MSAQISQSLSERDRVLAAIKRIEGKRDAATDELSRRYFVQCLIGWRQHLARLESESGSEAV